MEPASATPPPAAPPGLAAVDAHQHFWPVGVRPRTPGAAALDRAFTPADLERELAGGEVGRTVLVQCAAGPGENDRLAAYAREFAPVGALVLWLPLADPAAAERELARVRALTGLVRGFRAPVAPGTRADPALLATMRCAERAGLLWELVVTSESHVALAEQVAAACPGLPIVVDHLATPPLAGGEPKAWEGWIDRLAALPSASVKVSVGGDVLAAWEWEPELLVPWVGRALEAFGAHRSMLAGNWPVVRLAADHATAWRSLRAAVAAAGPSAAEAALVAGGAARRLYAIGEDRG
ncbi:amidohydrolase family protein [Nocardiopsis sp. NPDC101807]|uniref:amidohydrolase family protein n=1 Tax=Nocardiopsis sp. NPDC101807 TaxID=3364339 RepID=UPI00380BAA6C